MLNNDDVKLYYDSIKDEIKFSNYIEGDKIEYLGFQSFALLEDENKFKNPMTISLIVSNINFPQYASVVHYYICDMDEAIRKIRMLKMSKIWK